MMTAADQRMFIFDNWRYCWFFSSSTDLEEIQVMAGGAPGTGEFFADAAGKD